VFSWICPVLFRVGNSGGIPLTVTFFHGFRIPPIN
jgi:hypothetical protein